MFKIITDAPIYAGQRVLIRSSLNAPDIPLDDERLKQSARTIQYCLGKKARVTIIGHKGRERESLKDLHKRLSHYVPCEFIPDIVGKKAHHARTACQSGKALLLENIRCDLGETENSEEYARSLLYDAEVVVFDAFPVSHRKHASASALLAVARHSSVEVYAGIRFEEEVCALKNALSPTAPSFAALGGAKLATKVPLLHRLLEAYDSVAVGGVLANTLLHLQGVEVGKSKIEDVSDVEGIDDIVNSEKIIIPTSVAVERDGAVIGVPINSIEKKDVIKDVYFGFLPEKVSSVVWNGPMGQSDAGFTDGTKQLANKLIAYKGAHIVVGGGDTLSCLDEGIKQKFAFVSTGGGAMLHYLSFGTLPVLNTAASTKHTST